MSIPYHPEMPERAKELVNLFKKGELSKLIARKFDGKRDSVRKDDEDSNLKIYFPSAEKTPSKSALRQLIYRHFHDLGYVVEHLDNRIPDLYEGRVYAEDHRRHAVIITISTRYRLTDHPHKLCLTCHYHE